jgi:hypothetical protein
MKRLLALTLYASLTIGCSIGHANLNSKSKTMTFNAGTQDNLDAGNQRINAFKAELLKQGFREVSSSSFNTREESILEGNYGALNNLRVTLRTNTSLEKEEPELAGGISASLRDEKAEQEFDALYKKVSSVVSGFPE